MLYFVYGVVHIVPARVGGPQEQNSNIAMWCGCLFVNVGLSFIKCNIIVEGTNVMQLSWKKAMHAKDISAS